ncbi:MAG: DUF6171 family protein [Oscillospiraceae bacterium]|nr:DUF6171 family protein [Oscillospiraceae bacterium]
METPGCKRCLLRELAESETLRGINECRARLDADVRADETLYERRLQACRGCDSLLSGTCLLCGCYVELRAAMRELGCPAVPDRWLQEVSA